MVLKSRAENGSMNEAIRERFSKVPDPLHFELPHGHKKLLELIYFIVVVGAIIFILILGNAGVLSNSEVNASAMMVLVLAILLAIMIIEKSTITHKPSKA